MNIKEAKVQIKNAITAYFTKDEYDNYVIPIEKQRPVFVMGPPGIGKTAIMEQIASELGIGLLSYSMTHHTRQSALGLPFIERKVYGGEEYEVSEYTMSEIIASVYDMMEKSGVKEGILFLDEINCVSETLAPIMLQFLQYKIFGRHRIPEGWVVVTAGNPPEYNNSVREFDIVTWDRLKRIDVEPDFGVWKEYALQMGLHPSIMTYLEIKKMNFYKIESTVDGKTFVTARGWDDLSQMIQLYEHHGLNVDQKLIAQYIQNQKIAKDFATYYDLYLKYRSDYQIQDVLNGNATDIIKERARNAKFDERLSVIGLLLEGVNHDIKNTIDLTQGLKDDMEILKKVKLDLSRQNVACEQIMQKYIDKKYEEYNKGKLANSISKAQQKMILQLITTLENQQKLVIDEKDGIKAFEILKKDFDNLRQQLDESVKDTGKKLDNMFKFCEEVFKEGQELLIVVTELTANYHSAKYISMYGCPAYFRHNKELLFYERQREIEQELKTIQLD
jgi:hypothetical protein